MLFIYLSCAPTIYSGAICSGSTLSAESMPRERQLCCSSPGECLVLLLGVWEGRATQQTVSCWAHSSVSSQILLIVVTHAWFPKPLFWGLPPRPAWEGGLLLRPCLKGSSMASSPGSGWEGMWRPCTCGIPREDQAVDGRGGMMASRFISPWCWCLAEAQHHHVCDAWPCVCPACGGTGGTASLPLGRKKVWFFFFLLSSPQTTLTASKLGCLANSGFFSVFGAKWEYRDISGKTDRICCSFHWLQ